MGRQCCGSWIVSKSRKVENTLLTGHIVVIVSPPYLSAPSIHKMELMEHHTLQATGGV